AGQSRPSRRRAGGTPPAGAVGWRSPMVSTTVDVFAGARATLTVLTGAHAGRSVVVDVAPLEVGRGADADLVVEGTGMGLRHLRVARTVDDGFYAEDLGSESGTFLGENRIGIALLRTGDVLHLGPQVKLGFALLGGTSPG